MPDTDAPSRPAEPAGGPNEQRYLPVPVSHSSDADSDGFFARLARALFGWKNGPTRADIEVVLDATGPGEAGVSPEERTMIRNILALRGRRIEDVMVPRGDIIAVQVEISIGELVKVFEKAGHSRLVAYNDSLDDPVGMVHIRDLIAFMTAKAAVDPAKPHTAQEARASSASTSARSTSRCRCRRPRSCARCCSCRRRCRRSTCWRRCRRRASIWRWWWTSTAAPMASFRWRTSSSRSSAKSPTSTTRTNCPRWCASSTARIVADARASLDDVTAAVGVAFDVGDAAEEVDTIGGYLMTQVGRLPLRGELVPGPTGFEIEVLDSDPRRIKKVRIHRSKNRPIERDRDGRRRYSGPDMAAAPAPEGSAKTSPDSSTPNKS